MTFGTLAHHVSPPPLLHCPPLASLPTTIMSWLLPVAVVLIASVALAAVHFFFTRALARLSEPARTEPPDDSDNRAP